MERPLKQKIIGLLGGCSNVATAEYYRILNACVNERFGGWEIAETMIAGMNFGNIQHYVRNGDWAGLQEYLEGKTDALIAAGADIIMCASNTLHKAMEPIMAKRSTPFLHIVDPTGAAIAHKGLNRVAFFGTAPAMKLDYLHKRYEDKFGLEIIVPGTDEQTEIDRIIFNELVKDKFLSPSKEQYLSILDRLAKEEGAQGLIMGCTEIALLVQQDDRPGLPMFDTMKLHCDAAIALALC